MLLKAIEPLKIFSISEPRGGKFKSESFKDLLLKLKLSELSMSKILLTDVAVL